MYAIADTIKQAFLSDKRKVGMKIVIADTYTLYEDSIISLSISSTIGSSDTFTIGNYTTRQLNIELYRADAPLHLSNVDIEVYSGVEVDGSMEYFLIGTFHTDADSLVIERTTVSISAYDAMRKCKKGALSPKTKYTNKKLKFYADLLAKRLGVSLTDNAITFINKVDSSQSWTMDLEKGGNTVVRTMQNLALALGATAVITNDNKLDFITIKPISSLTLTPDFYTSLSLYDLDYYTIEGIKLTIPADISGKSDDAEYNYPNDDIGTYIAIEETKSDLFKDKTKDIKKQLKYISDNMLEGSAKALPLTYYGYELQAPSLPFLETGDTLTLETLEGNTYEVLVVTHELKYENGGFTSEIKAAIPSEESTNAVEASSGTITGALTIATTKILQVQNLVADSIEAGEAKIDDLEARKANVTDLTAATARIDSLEANKANVTDLTAATARIDTLEADKITTDVLVADDAFVNSMGVKLLEADSIKAVTGNYDTLIASKADVTDLEAANVDIENLKANSAAINTLVTGAADLTTTSTITLTADNATVEDAFIKDAMIDTINANKINSGTINTNNVTIQGSNGNFLISDNTLQIKDSSNSVRTQIGLDSNNNYNFNIYAEDGTVLFDALGLGENTVRDINVASDANISGDKINISSLYNAMNEEGESALNASKVLLNEEEASLEVAFSSMKNNLENYSTELNVLSTGVNLVTTSVENNRTAINSLTQTSNSLITQISETTNTVDGIKNFNTSYFQETADGKFIIGNGVSGNCAQMVLDTSEVQFVNAEGTVTAYFGTDGFATSQGILTTGILTIGTYAFYPRKDGSLDFKKVR